VADDVRERREHQSVEPENRQPYDVASQLGHSLVVLALVHVSLEKSLTRSGPNLAYNRSNGHRATCRAEVVRRVPRTQTSCNRAYGLSTSCFSNLSFTRSVTSVT
jgi:hypothetical protein